jgi:hypothetical protein
MVGKKLRVLGAELTAFGHQPIEFPRTAGLIPDLMFRCGWHDRSTSSPARATVSLAGDWRLRSSFHYI